MTHDAVSCLLDLDRSGSFVCEVRIALSVMLRNLRDGIDCVTLSCGVRSKYGSVGLEAVSLVGAPDIELETPQCNREEDIRPSPLDLML